MTQATFFLGYSEGWLPPDQAFQHMAVCPDELELEMHKRTGLEGRRILRLGGFLYSTLLFAFPLFDSTLLLDVSFRFFRTVGRTVQETQH